MTTSAIRVPPDRDLALDIANAAREGCAAGLASARSARPLVLEASNASLCGPKCAALKARLLDAIDSWAPIVLLDVRRVSWADARGLGLLVAIRRRASQRGVRFVVVAASEEFRVLLATSKLDTVIEQAESVGECVGPMTEVLYGGGEW